MGDILEEEIYKSPRKLLTLSRISCATIAFTGLAGMVYGITSFYETGNYQTAKEIIDFSTFLIELGGIPIPSYKSLA